MELTSKGQNRSSLDKHHIWYQARHYKKGALASLRQYPYTKVMIPRDSLHRIIHEYVGDIPAPSPASAQKAVDKLRELYLGGFISSNDNFEQRLKVLISLFDETEQPTIDALNKQLDLTREFYHSPP